MCLRVGCAKPDSLMCEIGVPKTHPQNLIMKTQLTNPN